MNASYLWLRSLVPFDESPEQLRDLLTARCATVDEVVRLGADLASIVVARVVAAARHPDSDHLSLTKVDAGTGELLDVVCGASNVVAGKRYAFAPSGTVMPNGLKIEKRKIRGAASNGMLCSARELGLGDDHAGIMELATDAPPGTPFTSVFPAGDTRLVIDVTPNRGDLLSHLGLAREIAAATGRPLALPAFPDASLPPGVAADEPLAVRSDSGHAGRLAVRVEAAELAPRYMAASIRGVRVAPSPRWLADRLEAVGSRPISNVVDATNYVLHELGQPVHAFDAARLGGARVVARRARAGERLVTIDGADRALSPEMLVIADGDRPQAIAGIMGGREAEVSAATTDLLIEVAVFDAAATRATRRALGLSTDASYRFERGVDPEGAPRALARVTQLIVALAGGTVEADRADLRRKQWEPREVGLRANRLARVLGIGIGVEEATHLLAPVGFRSVPQGTSGLRVTVPSWRTDIAIEADLVEEVARLRGYDSFPIELRPQRPSTAPDDPAWILARRVRETLASLGLLEAIPMPFVAGDGGGGYVRVANPLAENEAFLRRDLLSTLARRAEHNLAHMSGDVRLFEIGTAFLPGDGPRPTEELRVGALLMGARRPAHFTERTPPPFDEWDAKGLAEAVAAVAFGDGQVVLEPVGGAAVLWRVVAGGTPVGEVRRVPLDAPVWAAPAFGIELRLAVIDSAPVAGDRPDGQEERGTGRSPLPTLAQPRRIRPLATTPAVDVDLALVLPAGASAATVEHVIRTAAGELLERLQLLDEYRGAKLDGGLRSVLWRLTFRHPERTLGAKEVEGRRARVLRTLEAELGVRVRTS